jgi:hypothetical protein
MVVPDRLTFSYDMTCPSLSIKTDMELKVGDTVIFNYNAVSYAKSVGMEIDGGVLIPYDMIYAAIRDGEVICLSGSVIVEPESEMIKSSIFIPDMAQNQKLKTIGKVKYASTRPVEAIRHLPDYNSRATPLKMTQGKEFFELGRYVKPGDRVLFHFSNAIPLQHYQELHGTLSRTMLYRMRHNDIDLVLDDNVEIENNA